ncbi:Predicted unusual protein kinase regulating ubiquinone biosynthesis, AarF/ABC1/UbiB family [Enhydrobacter aerosaccus]|uniref:Predicted unusual protein kinase regulating ubiquinone biosynthesis, AarF/ABC1/UbiB family n=1 Tax=Enhydrobacter aerosaccus TaxID=225324 RepID=A0A1T4KCB6_9HYPH|nr:AarF/UbiB family protein [Enhydrobacter aerosaccus]SJZ39955.1 Predicted unusual protein kinase regulating ubiquinone biosynthesis, AarF/ABC1/UbiB family [Enhydrobacter aerosaccus]
MADEGDSLGGRLGRYARVGASVGGLAARLAGERYLGLSLDRDRHATELKVALGGLKGPLMKAAQLLATIPDALPPEYARELAQLQANAPAMGWAFVRRRMATELGPDWQAKFARFDKEASFAASLGQVHHAVLLGGQEAAVKLQYPDMSAALEADLNQLKLVFAIGQRFDPAIRTDEIHAEITSRLREELDYRREARHVALYRHMLRQEARIHVPEVVAGYSTDRLLTMNWLAGEPLLNWKARSQEERNALAADMFRAWYIPFYSYGVIHGDPHLGNYSVRADGSVNLMDFGCVRIFPPRFVRGSIELYRALMADDLDRAVAAYEDWGFSGLSRDMIVILNRWAAFLYGPLMDDRERRLTEGVAEGFGRDTAQKVFGELRRLGGVRPPREFVFMDRAAVGLGSVFIHLRASINWHRLFESLIDGFDVDALALRQQEALTEAGLS